MCLCSKASFSGAVWFFLFCNFNPMKKILFFILLLPLFFVSCRRDGGGTEPSVEFLSPANGAQYDIFDSIHVYVKMSDDHGLANLKFRLVDMNMSPVMPVIEQAISGGSYETSFDFPITNIRITTGNYYFYADVTDVDGNRRSINRIVQITEIPRELKGFFASTIPAANTLKIYKADTSWTASSWNQITSDFTDMAVSNYWQHVYISGDISGPLSAFSINGETPGWSQNAFPSSAKYWGGLSIADRRLLVSVRGQSQVRSLDETGAQGFVAYADNGYFPESQIQVANRIFIEEKEISTQSGRMVVFSSSGGSIQETNMSVDAMLMAPKDNDNIYVVGNGAGQGHLLIYDVAANGFWEPITLPTGLVTAATQIDSTTLLIAMDNGNLYRFTYSPVGLLTWASGINSTQLRYDPVNDELYSAEGMNVKVYSYNPFVLQHTVTFAETVRDLELWYNR